MTPTNRMHFANRAELKSALDLPSIIPGAFRFAKPWKGSTFTCCDCGKHVEFPVEGCGTGYGYEEGDPGLFCYPCGGTRTRKRLIETGKGHLYLATNKPGRSEVTDWTGTLRLPCYVAKGRHNMARWRYDVWFTLDGAEWHGVQYGDYTQICHVRRLKPKAKAAA
jgi:hypothetical protein